MEGVIALFIPIALFFAIAIVICVLVYYRYRSASEVQQTVRSAIEQGQELSAEFLEKLSKPDRSRNADLRRGIIAIGIGLAAFGALIGDEDAQQSLLAIAVLPACIGLAYLGLWKFSPRE
jgi:hypothetical protein